MAAIEKIRKRSGLLIAIIGLALLAFVLQDLFQSTGRHREYNVAVVDGEKIPYKDFEDLKDKNIENMKRNYGSNNLTSSQTYSVYNSTLEQMIKDHIMTKEYNAIGMNVSAEELYDQFVGEDPHEWVMSSFRDANGNFDRQQLENYMQQLDNAPMEYRAQWVDFENAVKEDRLTKKFDNLVKASYFLPTKLADKYYTNKNDKSSADIVALRYTSIPDSTVVVTDQDNKAFYEENKYKYETDETRGIEYVVFDIKPSAADEEDARNYVADMKADFAATDNVANYVNANSDTRYDSTWLTRTDVPAVIESAIFDEGNQPGFVYGPYFDQEAYKLARIVDMQERADSLRASHILIPYMGALRSEDTVTTKEEAQKRADSICNVLKKTKDVKLFGQLAGKFSSDKGSAEKEGDLDWFTDGVMVYSFNEFVMNNPVGQIGVVESPFGYHIIKVTGKTEMKPKARLAVLSHDLSTSTKTYQDVFAKANKFVTENRTYDQFNATIEAEGMTKRTQPRLNASTYQIAGIENPRQIVRWAFDKKTKVGDISSIFELDDMFVVAALTEVIPEGYAPLEKIAEQSKYQILNKKKGEIAVSKMQACGNDYDRMVNELGAESTTVNDITLESRSVGNFGVDDKVVGIILGMKEGEVVGPVAGNSTAFIIKNVKHNATATATDYPTIQREKKAQFDNKVLNGGVYNALKNNAKIEDNRVMFF